MRLAVRVFGLTRSALSDEFNFRVSCVLFDMVLMCGVSRERDISDVFVCPTFVVRPSDGRVVRWEHLFLYSRTSVCSSRLVVYCEVCFGESRFWRRSRRRHGNSSERSRLTQFVHMSQVNGRIDGGSVNIRIRGDIMSGRLRSAHTVSSMKSSQAGSRRMEDPHRSGLLYACGTFLNSKLVT